LADAEARTVDPFVDPPLGAVPYMFSDRFAVPNSGKFL
jgi:hypothetical protein